MKTKIAFISMVLLIGPSWAKLVRIQITNTQSVSGGQSFSSAGPYEAISGIMYFEVDPENAANALIHDLDKAPVNSNGMVEFDADFLMHKPVDPSRGNGRLMYFVNNRGGMSADRDVFHNKGEGSWLYDNGWTYFWNGWNGDATPGGNKMNIRLPIATENGETITGKVYAEITTNSSGQNSLPMYWGGSIMYPEANPGDKSEASLSRREFRDSSPIDIADNQWSITSGGNLQLNGGFMPGWLYDLVYVAKDPRVTGLGFAAIRDAMTFLRYDTQDENGNDNPLAGAIEKTFGFGISQSGRVLHHIVWEGFNGDEQDRVAFDGLMPFVPGAGTGMFNSRFAQTTRHASMHEDHYFPADVFPFNTIEQTDPVTGETGNLLARSLAAGNMPKMMIINTSTEYWTRAASLLHTNVYGTEDAGFDPSTRYYFIAGYHHWSREMVPICRALLVALDNWVTDDTDPPPSVIPRISDGTLWTWQEYQENFPDIPAIDLPTGFLNPYRLDFGPRWKTEGIMDNQPPIAGERYVNTVPAVNADGNELTGIKMPETAIPVATRMGWQLRTGAAAGTIERWPGSVFAFPRNPGSNDPRESIEERYPAENVYMQLVEYHLDVLIDQGFILAEEKDWLMDESLDRARDLNLSQTPIDVQDVILGSHVFTISPLKKSISVPFAIVAVEIVNIQGQTVHRIETPSPGEQVTWDGSTQTGKTLLPGMYIVRVLGEGQRYSEKVVLF